MQKTHITGLWLARAALALAVLSPARGAYAQDAAAPAPATAPTGPVSAEPVSPGARCAASYEQAQTDKVAGHYISATAAALACSQIECNPAIVRECVQLYAALERETPSFVVAARKAEGGELIDVKVEMDGKLISDHITGRPFPIDPGPHVFVFTHAQRGRLETTASARVGEQARVVEVTFVDPLAKAPALPAALPPEGGQRVSSKSVPVMSYVLGGVGLVGLGGFAYFRLSGVADYNDYNSTCAPACNPDDVDGIRTKFLLSYVSLGVGIAGLAGAGLVYAFGRGSDEQQVEASITPRVGGAMAGVRTRF